MTPRLSTHRGSGLGTGPRRTGIVLALLAGLTGALALGSASLGEQPGPGTGGPREPGGGPPPPGAPGGRGDDPTNAPDGAPSGGPGSPGARGRAGGLLTTDRGQLRELVERAIERGEQFVQRLRRAREELDGGTPPADVARDLQRLRAEFVRGEFLRGEADGQRGPMNQPGNLPGGPGSGPGAGPGPGRGPGASGGPGGGLVALDGAEAGRPLNPEERERARAFLAQERPALLKQIDELSGRRPEASQRLLEGLGNRVRGIWDLKQRDPQLMQLRLEDVGHVLEVGRARGAYLAARRAEGADAEKLKGLEADLRKAVASAFDCGLRLREHEVSQLKKRAEEMAQRLVDARAGQERSIDEKTRSLTKPTERRPEPRERPDPPKRPGDREPAR